MGDHIKGALIAVLIILALVAIGGLGYWVGHPAKVIEQAAPEVKQADGSIIAERAPDPKAKPKQQIPKGGKVERTGEYTALGGGLKIDGVLRPCPPVTIDTTLVRMPDGSKRVTVSSPDGTITHAIDIPVETAAPAPEPKQWAAGLSYDPIKQTGGLWIERDVMRVRLGAEIGQARLIVSGPSAIEARVRIGMTF